MGFKTHGKIAVVVRKEKDGIRRYFHVGTGNYNPKTAKIYEDVGLLSSDPDIGLDLMDLFNFLTGYCTPVQYRKILVAPTSLRKSLLAKIEEEAAVAREGGEGRIVMKMNNLADMTIIEALYAASSAGVQIDLIVRGACTLRPGIKGLSENVKVRSIVGKYLEHSRIFAFGNGTTRPQVELFSLS